MRLVPSAGDDQFDVRASASHAGACATDGGSVAPLVIYQGYLARSFRMPTVLAISGSLRAKSFNTMLLHAAVEVAPAIVTIETASIKDIPLYDGDVEASGFPTVVVALKERIAAADGLLLVSPEYNNGIPGVFKKRYRLGIATGQRYSPRVRRSSCRFDWRNARARRYGAGASRLVARFAHVGRSAVHGWALGRGGCGQGVRWGGRVGGRCGEGFGAGVYGWVCGILWWGGRVGGETTLLVHHVFRRWHEREHLLGRHQPGAAFGVFVEEELEPGVHDGRLDAHQMIVGLIFGDRGPSPSTLLTRTTPGKPSMLPRLSRRGR